MMSKMLGAEDTIIPSKRKKFKPEDRNPMYVNVLEGMRSASNSPMNSFFDFAAQYFGDNMGDNFGQNRVSRTKMTSV